MHDPSFSGYRTFQTMFFTGSGPSQEAGEAFVRRLEARVEDTDPPAGPKVGPAQTAAFKAWESEKDPEFTMLRQIAQPTLVMHGAEDLHIGAINGFTLARNIPNATLLMYPDAAHGAYSQFRVPFVNEALRFLVEEQTK